jgi:hypothetical protein
VPQRTDGLHRHAYRGQTTNAPLFTVEGAPMNRTLILLSLCAAASLAACDKPAVVAVPGPPGPAGETGSTGKTGDSSTVIVLPPAASAASN